MNIRNFEVRKGGQGKSRRGGCKRLQMWAEGEFAMLNAEQDWGAAISVAGGGDAVNTEQHAEVGTRVCGDLAIVATSGLEPLA